MSFEHDDLVVFESLAAAVRARFGKPGYDAYALALHRAGDAFQRRLLEEQPANSVAGCSVGWPGATLGADGLFY